jgi:hypothetical protein
MKKVYLVVASALLFGVSISASPISPGTGCPGHHCLLQPVQTVSSSSLLSSANLTSLASPATTSLTSSLTTASNLLSQNTATAPLAAPAPANSSLGFNPVVPDFKVGHVKGASPASEPSTLLLLAAGLLFLPVMRKTGLLRKALRPNLA